MSKRDRHIRIGIKENCRLADLAAILRAYTVEAGNGTSSTSIPIHQLPGWGINPPGEQPTFSRTSRAFQCGSGEIWLRAPVPVTLSAPIEIWVDIDERTWVVKMDPGVEHGDTFVGMLD